MSFSAKIQTRLEATNTKDLDLTQAQDVLNLAQVFSLTEGTSANQAQIVFHDRRELAASSSEELDLAGGLTDAFGRTLTFISVKAILIRAAEGNIENVEVGGAALNAFVGWVKDYTDVLVIKPGGLFLLVDPGEAGYPVTSDSGDILQVANGGAGGTVTYDIVIIGEGTAA